VTEYLLELPLVRFIKYHLLLSNFARVQIKDGNVLLLPSGLFIFLSIVPMKETNCSNIAADSVACNESVN